MSEDYTDECKKRPFHPLDQPHGSKNYDPAALEPEQQEILDSRKVEQRRENESYLNDHPEIRGLTSMLFRHLLEKKPTSGDEVLELAATFFGRSCGKIAQELLYYLREIKYEGAIIEHLKKVIDVSSEDSEILTSSEENVNQHHM